MKSRSSHEYVSTAASLVALGDVVALNAAFLLAFILRFGFSIDPRNFVAYLQAAPVFSAVFVGMLLAFDLYRKRRVTVRTAITTLGRPILLTALFGASFVLFAGWFSFPRSVILIGFLLGGPLVLAWRLLVAKGEEKYRGTERISVIIDRDSIGETDQRETLRRLAEPSDHHVELVGVVDHRNHERIDDLSSRSDMVVISAAVPQASRAQLTTDVLANGCRVFIIPAAFDLSLHTGTPSHFYNVEGIELSTGRPPAMTAAFKRAGDIVAAALVLLLTAPLALVVAWAVPRDSDGPVLFRQKRVGRGQREFTILKFRTMAADAEVKTGPVFATQNDPRITRLGHWLRKTRIDEIPQMWNVLKGDMSLVGPRPERPEFVTTFSRTVPAYDRRFMVRPGVTGMAQVKAGYAATVEEKLRFDLLYINQMSLVTDLRVGVQTISTILNFSAAEGVIDLRDLPDDVEALLAEEDGGSERVTQQPEISPVTLMDMEPLRTGTDS